MAAVVTADALCKSYATRGEDLVVLRDVSLALQSGEAAAIMGPSGSGKSTLLNILGTLDSPTSGRVTIDGSDPFQLSEGKLATFRNERVGFVFQDHHLLPQCSALENVLLPTLADPSNPDASERARALMERVGLQDRAEHRPAELSGGERQRVAIARALINGPAVLLADEPTGNLDRATAERVADLLDELHRSEGFVLLIVTHSDKLAERFARRFELIDGALVSP
jgi:lipoprotein-releasing system ATP-binding protein